MLSSLCGFPRVHPILWRFIGFVSSLVGLITYAMSPPLNKVFKQGELGFLVVVIYCALGSLLCCLMLFTTTWSLPKKTVLTAHVVFFVLMVTSVYSFYLDKTEGNTKAKDGDKVLNLVSCGAFSLMSLSLSRLSGLGFEAGVFNFFLGSLMMAVMKWNLKFALAAAAFCYILISIRTYSENSHSTGDIEVEEMALIQNNGTWEGFEFQSPIYVPLFLRPPVTNDVFISFRAKDTSDIPEYFTCALLNKLLRVYAHPELTGNYVSPAVVKEIEKAKVCVIIFSQSYLDATWCMDEVHNIMACRARYGRTVIPIFYNIDRTTIQHYLVNFCRIKMLCDAANGVSEHDMYQWSNHLAAAASLQGWEMSENRRPYEILDDVANHPIYAYPSYFPSSSWKRIPGESTKDLDTAKELTILTPYTNIRGNYFMITDYHDLGQPLCDT
ncbi:Disease resistance protein RLM3, partial [Mucuna pruriens]